MLTTASSTNRYSDKDLAEFKVHIEQKLESARNQIASFQERIDNISETKDNDGDWMDDTSNLQDLEMLYSMISRQQKHIRDLENALIRVHTKRYGICIVTGELIDKRRLLAVPTTNKCLAAKLTPKEKPEREEIKIKPKTTKTPTSFSRVIKRTGGTPKPVVPVEMDEDDDDFDMDNDYDDDDAIDMDLIVDESSLED
ncbi:MAG: TraR/DksA C4-type zinc finger protein [Bacteroidota bacterium]